MQKFLFSLLLLLFVSATLSAQTEEDRARQDLDYYDQESGNQVLQGERFSDRLWFGGGMQLAFQGGGGASLFIIGLSPMVGYKITSALSVGPRVSANYNAYRENFGTQDFKVNYVTWSAGMMARMRAFQSFFVQAEYAIESDVIGFNPSSGDPIRRNRGVPYLGVGYNPSFGGGVSSDAVFLFRLNNSEFIQEPPFVIRFGLTFNF